MWLDWRVAAVASICLIAVTPLMPRARHRAFDTIRPFAVETAIVLALYALWQWAATLGAGKVTGAEDRGLWIWRVEQALHWPSEAAIERLFLHKALLMQAMNLYYLGVHVPALGVLLVWLFVRHRSDYARWRTTGAILTGVSLAIQLIPVAPPRLLPGLGFVDAAALYHQSVYGPGGIDIAPQVAAMPSVHVGWAVFIAIVVVTVSPSRWRWLVVIHPLATMLVVVATANHWWLDGVVSVLLLPICYLAQVGLTRAGRMLRQAGARWRDATLGAATQVACGPVTRHCERPGCAEPGVVSYGFDARQRVAWLAPLDGDGGGVLCERHAQRFVVPRGWWLNDRREDAALFAPAPVQPVARPARRRRKSAPKAEPADPVGGGGLLLAGEPVEPAPAPAADAGATAWGRRIASMGDLGGLLDARTPLLARAFRQPDTSGERPSSAGDAVS